jgi:predicted neutral ceramidase superfamily lipid hydrolase
MLVERAVGLVTVHSVVWVLCWQILQADCMSVTLLAAATLLVWLAITFLLVSTLRWQTPVQGLCSSCPLVGQFKVQIVWYRTVASLLYVVDFLVLDVSLVTCRVSGSSGTGSFNLPFYWAIRVTKPFYICSYLLVYYRFSTNVTLNCLENE